VKPALAPEERFARLRLARTDRIGPVTFLELLRREGSALRAVERLPELSRRAGGSAVRVADVAQAESEMERGEALRARLIVLGDDTYPKALAALDAPPPVLWTRGRSELLSADCLAIVGARVASAAGQRFAQGLAVEAGAAGFVVVSGMARGVDAAAHQGSLMTGSVAVLGGGVDDIYPPDNAALYGRLTDEGCVVSESPVGHRAQARDFPRRNRIISGLSRAVVVVEAEMRSGSLITARLAAEQGREVLAVPGSPLDPRCQGSNDLIRQGAALCEGMADILRALEGRWSLYEPTSSFDVGDRDISEPADEGLADVVLALLGPTPIARDEVVRRSGGDAGAVMGVLLELNLSGLIHVGDDGSVARLT
jgi:DNA processing protein